MSKLVPGGNAAPEAASEENGFLSRWSRRKREVQAAGEAHVTLPEDATPVLADASSPEDTAEAELAAEQQAEAARQQLDELIATLPKVEEITAATDVTGYMDVRIPDMLRNAALRATWSSDPAIRDFLNDAREYALDYNTPGAAPGYGLLSDSERASAAEFVKTLFSDAPATASKTPPPDDTLVVEKPETTGEISDEESRSQFQPEIAALHKIGDVPVRSGALDLSEDAFQAGNMTNAVENGMDLPDDAPQREQAQPGIVLHDVTASSSEHTSFRRRGGGALPV